MKLVHPDFFFQIELSESKVINIIIESPDIFESMINELHNQIIGNEGQWVLSKNNTPIEIKRYSEIILNPFNIDINNKRILGKLYDDIKNNTTKTDLYIRWTELYPKVSEVVDYLIEDFDYNLEYDDEIEIKEFLKLMNLKFNIESTNSLEKIIDYMNLHSSILGTKVFILVNVHSFYTQEKLKYLYEQAFYKKYHLLLLECKVPDTLEVLEERYIIDKDGCVIKS
ncbi:MAG: type II-A CRISPR-associated protein Csn2 [Clostridium sp.]|uniref:type II-A CRISPR-associated protein Csn2 n=1 Tax=Clostridium sp. TaxID=1506 RepID=UPI0025C254CE|nr:type II-A CRISPR-associated protein Csn2 [Clostridium sp.]MCF0147545.1 type II-A CRISPR-associated protein Csn2 [Clostridium sp.]